MKRLLLILASLFFVGCFVAFFVFQLQWASGVFPFDAQLSFLHYTKEIARTTLQALVMFVGIVFGFLYRRSHEVDEPQFLISKEFKSMLASTTFYRTLFAAPLVFCSVHIFTKTAPDTAAALIFAFQNGFFCKVLLERTEDQRIKQLATISLNATSSNTIPESTRKND
jgi:hypothetical protein